MIDRADFLRALPALVAGGHLATAPVAPTRLPLGAESLAQSLDALVGPEVVLAVEGAAGVRYVAAKTTVDPARSGEIEIRGEWPGLPPGRYGRLWLLDSHGAELAWSDLRPRTRVRTGDVMSGALRFQYH